MSFQDDNRLVILGLMSTNEIIETTLNVPFENVPLFLFYSISRVFEVLSVIAKNNLPVKDAKEATLKVRGSTNQTTVLTLE